jgi:hypothetical protein
MDRYADIATIRQLVNNVREELDTLDTELSVAVSPEGADMLRAALERVETIEYDPGQHGPLLKRAAETLLWLQSECDRHGDQVTAIHQLVTDAGYPCARKDLETVVAGIFSRSSS